MGRPTRAEGPLVHFWFRKRAEKPGAHPQGLWRDPGAEGLLTASTPFLAPFGCVPSLRGRGGKEDIQGLPPLSQLICP